MIMKTLLNIAFSQMIVASLYAPDGDVDTLSVGALRQLFRA